MKDQKSSYNYLKKEYFYERRIFLEYILINKNKIGHSAIEQVLGNRGITDIMHYLNTTDADILDPLGLKNMREGAKMLISHIAADDPVFIQIDSDCDGYTSAAALINYLNYLFPHFAQTKISYRVHGDKAHGLLLGTIPKDVKLVIAPDSSSEDYEVHKQLKERGVDVLVLDHHEAERESEYACIINNQLCDYKTKSLSGVGIVYKFCSYLDSLLGTEYADEILDLVALGMTADMMSLLDCETKHLIQKGLEKIQNPFFKGMTIKNEYSLGERITPFGVSFYIAPYINAITRSGTIEEKMVLFESMLDFKAYDLIPSTKRGYKGQDELRVEQACRTSINVKNRQTKVRDASLEAIQCLIEEENLLDNKVLAIRLRDGQKSTLSGLIANQLMSIYQKPVLILSETEHDGEIWWEGSCRGPNLPGLEDCKAFYESSGLVEYCQGHANAFGLGIRNSKYEGFINWCNEQLKDFEFTPKYKVDFIYDAKNVKDNETDFYNLMEYSNLWGQDVQAPLIAIENVMLTQYNIDLMKGTTLKVELPNDCGVNLIKFKTSAEEYEVLRPESEIGCVRINVVGSCEKNSYTGRPQLIIKDYEIVDKQSYYF